ncbi:MAG: hypothetical protein JWQ76_3976 [Ramlibacter sp.]|nr:hypothetical protein [Ramlibacter sp.]
MRFSAVFQLPLAPRLAVERAAPVRVEEPAAPVTPGPRAPQFADLPEDLDQRVRMVGEWQLGED